MWCPAKWYWINFKEHEKLKTLKIYWKKKKKRATIKIYWQLLPFYNTKIVQVVLPSPWKQGHIYLTHTMPWCILVSPGHQLLWYQLVCLEYSGFSTWMIYKSVLIVVMAWCHRIMWKFVFKYCTWRHLSNFHSLTLTQNLCLLKKGFVTNYHIHITAAMEIQWVCSLQYCLKTCWGI